MQNFCLATLGLLLNLFPSFFGQNYYEVPKYEFDCLKFQLTGVQHEPMIISYTCHTAQLLWDFFGDMSVLSLEPQSDSPFFESLNMFYSFRLMRYDSVRVISAQFFLFTCFGSTLLGCTSLEKHTEFNWIFVLDDQFYLWSCIIDWLISFLICLS